MSSNLGQPKTMDDNAFEEAILEKSTDAEALDVLREEDIYFSEVLKLHLESKRIQKIENLGEFLSLTKLDLNCNLIEKIEGLDCLINLMWLNLSFNRIEKIEGLESLQKLEMLNLCNNRISVIENMDTLENLTNFFVADNLLGQLEDVLYLRKFKKLFSISLSGNPVSKEDNYKFFIAAFFPNLKLLDHKLLDEMTKNEASIEYSFALETMRSEELQKQQADEIQQSQEAELKLHKDAFVEFLNGSCLFKSMFKDDPKVETLRCVPEVASLLQTFEQQMVALCMQLFETGLAEYKQRETEVNSFFSGQNKIATDYQQKASQIMEKFDLQHRESMAELQQLSDPDVLTLKITHCNDEINQLCKSLRTLEFQLTSHLQGIIKKLDISLSDMVGIFTDTAQGIFVQCQDLEDNYYQKVQEVAVATLEKVAKDSLEEDMPEDVVMLFTDKDAVMDALATGHDNHMLKINDRETQLVKGVNTWKGTLVKGIEDKELKLNRKRLSDILRYTDYLREQLERFQ